DDRSLERAARTWLEEGPTRAPDRAINGALVRIRTINQERELWLPWRFHTMQPIARFATLAVVLALAIGGAFLAWRATLPAVGHPAPTVEGTWEVSFTHAEMLAAGLVDSQEDDPSNYGHFWLTFRNGTQQVVQLGAPGVVTTGSYTVTAAAISIVSPADSATFVMPITVTETTLTFGRGGPVTYRVKPWARIAGPGVLGPATSPATNHYDYKLARDAICIAARVPRATIDSRIGPGLYDPTTPAALRAAEIAGSEDMWQFAMTELDVLDSLPVPSDMSADESASISDGRKIADLIGQELPLLRAGKLSDAQSLDQATDPYAREIEAFESKYGLQGCP
ncbi:MAG TPA: hypothetical protein VF484_06635, partial [Candidatus Limnocylindrales bacterium]